MSVTAWWLSDPTGTRRRIGAGGLLIGRASDCDVIVTEPEVSRHQALVHLESSEPRFVPLGAAPSQVNDRAVDAPTPLREGDTIAIGELRLGVTADLDAEDAPRWLVQLTGGGLYSIAKRRFTVGGSAQDDLRADGLGAGLVVLQPAAGFLSVEAGGEGVQVAKRLLDVGGLASARVGDLIQVGDLALRVLAGDAVADETSRHHLPNEIGAAFVKLSFLPRGGRVELRVEGKTVTVYLAERRCNLVACLLQPPDGFAPGEFVDDEIVIPRIWPNQNKGRTDLNTLLHRARKDLIGAGVDGASLLDRADGGGATRFRLRPNAAVHIE